MYISLPSYSCVRQYIHSNLVYYKHNGDDETYDSITWFKKEIRKSNDSQNISASNMILKEIYLTEF